MAYAKTTWVDGAAPALDASHLNNLENGLEDVDVRLTTAESTITTLSTSSQTITDNSNAITALQNGLQDYTYVLTGTFSGIWSPTLLTTFNITNYTDYNWTVAVHQTSRVTTNGHTVVLDGYVDADDNTIRLSSTDDGVAVAARYTIVGYKKTINTYIQLNN